MLLLLLLGSLWSFPRVLFLDQVNGFLRVINATARHDRYSVVVLEMLRMI